MSTTHHSSNGTQQVDVALSADHELPGGRSGRRAGGVIEGIERWKAADQLVGVVHDRIAPLMDQAGVTEVLSGRAIGHPVHPVLVQLPIGCWSAGTILDAFHRLRDRRASRTLIGLGVLSALPAVTSGLFEWRHTDGAERRVGAAHAAMNATALTLFGCSWWKRRPSTDKGRLLSVAGMAFVSIGGWLGGHLAYVRGVGVNVAAFTPVPREWTRVASRDEVTDDGTGAQVGEATVLLTRDPYGADHRHRRPVLTSGRSTAGRHRGRRMRPMSMARQQVRGDERKGAPRPGVDRPARLPDQGGGRRGRDLLRRPGSGLSGH